MLQEINLMEKLSFDRNIVQFYGAVLSAPAPMLVLEFMEGMPSHRVVEFSPLCALLACCILETRGAIGMLWRRPYK